mgnify:CR=1 FL=1
MGFEAVIGLEVHSQIKTNTKLFSSSNIDYGCDPNSNVSEIDLGYASYCLYPENVIVEGIFRA